MAPTTPQESYLDIFDPGLPTYSDLNLGHRRLYTAVLHLLKTRFAFDKDDDLLEYSGSAPNATQTPVKLKLLPQDFPGNVFTGSGEKKKAKVYFLAVYGRLLAVGLEDPANGRRHEGDAGDNESLLYDPDLPQDPAAGEERKQIRVVPAFVRGFTAAVERWYAYDELYERVFTILQQRGQQVADVDGSSSGNVAHIFAGQLAQIVDRLIEQRVSYDSPQLKVIIEQAVDQAVGGSIQGRASSIRIDLPDLELEDSVEIISDNVRALAVLYYAAQLEDMRFFSVADKVAEHFQHGMLPLSRGLGGDYLYEYIRGATNRFTEVERRGLYARAFGFAQGGIDEALPNREFTDLWIRALSASSAFARQRVISSNGGTGNTYVLPSDSRRVHHMQVYKALRDLGTNLSLHGYAMAHFAAIELQQTIKQVKGMLSNAEVLGAYGVRDTFQLVERVAQLYMNSNVNSIRQRVTAQSGSRIIEWLANRSSLLADSSPPKEDVFLDPGLIDNVEKWLAVTGTPDATVEQFSEPIAMSSQPTIPSMGLSSVTQSLQGALDAIGVDAGNVIPEA